MITFQEIVRRLSHFWEERGCIIHQGYDLEAGAGTFNPATFLRCLGPEPYRAAYIEPCRRPSDGRYGENPNRLQHYFQYQVILKPSPLDIQETYLRSLEAIGFDLSKHDIRFVHDDWENPTIGAWGLGWEVWCDGMEVTQFTYFQSVGGVSLKPITVELTYGIERLAMYIQGVDSIFDLQWNDQLSYGDIYHRSEVEWSHYNFEHASTEMWFRHFEDYEKEAKKLMEQGFPVPAYDFIMKASHAFNILDARGVISVTERTGYIGRIRDLARLIAESYAKSREDQAFPLMGRFQRPAEVEQKIEPLSDHLKQGEPNEKRDFLFEIGSEELPATFVPVGCRNLEREMRRLLDKEGIAYEEILTYGTPRRLAVYVMGLAMGKAAVKEEKRGPAVAKSYDAEGNPQPAALGFFRSLGIEAPALSAIKSGEVPSVRVHIVKDAEYLFATKEIKARATAEILVENLASLIGNLEFPKKMHWADLEITYARPLQWVVALFGDEVLSFSVANLVSGRTSFGHSQLCKKPFEIAEAKEYLPRLKEHKVLVDIKERREEIEEQLAKIDGEIVAKERVIPQVLHLVEWPQLTVAPFDSQFLKAPKEVLISEMVEHQKYFPVANPDGTLKNQFVITADNIPTDEIRRGNQKVLSARLSDGVFLYEQDLKVPLEKFNEKLKHMTFQKEWGSVYDKVQRIKEIAQKLQEMLQISDLKTVQRAGDWCKADLASAMVYEFPELQGVMGKYYALQSGETKAVAQAIEEHWMPKGEQEPLPESDTGTLLSLADKIDNLICCFSAGLKPTSSSDPYALRRQTLGMIKMLIKGKHFLSLPKLFSSCLPEGVDSGVVQELLEFFTNRVKTVFQDFGFSKDEIEASVSGGVLDIYDTFCRVQALHNFREASDQFPKLFEVYKRAKGQINRAEKEHFSHDLLQEDAEIQLVASLNDVTGRLDQSIKQHQYDHAYSLIAKLQQPLANLFDQVRILADDPKLQANRIALLQRIFSLFGKLIDFSKIKEKSA